MLIRYLYVLLAYSMILGAACWFIIRWYATAVPDGDRLPRLVVEAGRTVYVGRKFMFGGVAIVAVPEGALDSENRGSNSFQPSYPARQQEVTRGS